MTVSQANKTLAILLFVCLLGVAGIAFPYPILAPLFLNDANALAHFAGLPAKWLLGLVLAIYPLGVLLGSSVLGSLSDKIGRKKVLLLSLLASVGGYLMSAYAIYQQDFVLLMLSRFVTGLCEGNIAVARAIAADLSPTLDKTRTFAWLNAVMYGGWLIGPLAGGLLAAYGDAMPFVVAAGIIALAVVTVMFGLKETPTHAQDKDEKSSHNAFVMMRLPGLKKVFWVYLFLTLGINTFYEFYPLWLAELQNFGSLDIARMTVIMTSFMIITSVFAVSPLKKRMSETNLIVASVGFLALTVAILPALDALMLISAFAIMGVFIAIYNGLFSVFVSDKFDQYGQGSLMGMLTTIFCLSNVIVAILGAALSLLHTTYTLWLGSGFLLLGVLSFILLLKPMHNLEPQTSYS